MPQLDKFTYFTQFFWSCLFLFTFYVAICYIKRKPRFFFNLHYFLYIHSHRFQRTLLIFVLFFMVIRSSFLLFQNFQLLYFSHNILPSEVSLLHFYLNQPDQDPEWVEYVRQGLQSPGLSSRAYEVMVRDFLNTEMCFETRNQIVELYQILYYGREGPSFFIDPSDLDLILRVHLEDVTFNHSALIQVLASLCTEGRSSSFYWDVQRAQAEHFDSLLNCKQETRLKHLELCAELESLERKRAFLIEENASIREKLLILDRERGKF